MGLKVAQGEGESVIYKTIPTVDLHLSLLICSYYIITNTSDNHHDILITVNN